jgi:hypothetical protein
MNANDWALTKASIPLSLEYVNSIELKNEFGEFRVGTETSLRSIINPAPILAGMIRTELEKYIGKYPFFFFFVG